MKCPNCGKWNQANLPHCRFCGAEFTAVQQNAPAWQSELEDKVRAKSYIRVDEAGEIENTIDPRDKLAGEMAELKKRKLENYRVDGKDALVLLWHLLVNPKSFF